MMARRRGGRRLLPGFVALGLVLGGPALTACSGAGLPGLNPRPAASGSASRSAPTPGSTPDTTAGPSSSASGSDPTPGGTGSPSATPSGGQPPVPGGSATPSGSTAAVSCDAVTPVRIQKLSTEPRRTTEVVSVVSDGRNVTSGTREQSDFSSPELTGPSGTVNTDESTMAKIADLIEGSAKNVVLLTRPNPPDTGADANRRPFNAPGTYVLFNASTPLVADVIVQCSGQEQRWVFTAEADPTTGQVNCAVEPPQTNAIARLVYTSNC